MPEANKLPVLVVDLTRKSLLALEVRDPILHSNIEHNEYTCQMVSESVE